MNRLAISVVDASKAYGTNGVPVLQNLSMSVESGTIYGLIGASGSGKTTLLNCIMGLRNLDDGIISVLNHDPSQAKDGTLSSSIGHMPQEIALFDPLSIIETFRFFGSIHGMSYAQIRYRARTLINLLNLPEETQIIKTLSGGQQRRVSLAIAMLHEPKLLILDEPTVGVDPLLRQLIWQHITGLVSNKGTTILVTTHYTEEVHMCDMVGFMRRGKLIAEDNPKTLLSIHSTDVLENVLVALCRKDDDSRMSEVTNARAIDINQNKMFDSNRYGEIDVPCQNVKGISYRRQSYNTFRLKRRNSSAKYNVASSKPPADKNMLQSSHFSTEIRKVWAIVRRNLALMKREPTFLGAQMFLPIIQILICVFYYGVTPKGVKVGVYNQDAINCTDNSSLSLSCNFLTKLEANNDFIIIPTDSSEMARSITELGDSYGYLSIPANFTHNTLTRLALKKFATSQELVGSTVNVSLDMSSKIISFYAIENFIKTYFSVMKDLGKSLQVDEREIEIPLKFNAIYGSEDFSWTDFFAPSNIPLIFFCLSMTSGVVHAQDVMVGTFDRSIISGLKIHHYYIAYYITDTMTIAVQMILLFCIYFLTMGLNVVGSVWVICLLCFLGGWCGVAIGQVLSSIFGHPFEVVISGLFIAMWTMIVCGAQWPLEAVNVYFKFALYWFHPLPQIINSVRAVWNKGWGLTHPVVLPSVILDVSFIVTCFILCLIIHKMERAK